MTRLADVSLESLQDLLAEAESREATRRLMATIAVKQGEPVREVADWYGFDEEDVEEWISEFESGDAREVVAEVERFELPGRGTKPVVHQPGVAQVTFLDYEVVEDHGWSVDDPDLFEKAASANLGHEDYGRIAVEQGESILDAVENRDYEWPYACRGGACSNCAVVLKSGEIAMPGQQILPESAVERGARLTCVGVPVTEEVELVYNAKHLDYLDELRLPPGPFRQ